MDKSSTSCEQLIEEAKKQAESYDYGAIFRADLYSNPVWNDGTSVENPFFSAKDNLTVPKSLSSMDSVKEESSDPLESRDTPLKVVEMYVKKGTPFEWTDEYKDHDLERRIEAYNSVTRGMEITLHEDGINFGLYVQVNMNLSREIMVVEENGPPTVTDFVNTEKRSDEPALLLTINTFNLPQDTMEVIYINSKTTARQTIVKLFKKLQIVNYPRKYVLYEYEPQIDETAGTLTKKLTRILDDACPLKVILNWPIPHCGRALVLQENRDITNDTVELPLHDIFMRVSGLKKKDIDVRMQQNSRTGSIVTTYSKRDRLSKLIIFVPTGIFFIILFVTACFDTYYSYWCPEKFSPNFWKSVFDKFIEEFMAKLDEASALTY